MKSWGEIILVQKFLHPFAMYWRELSRIPIVGGFLGGDSGPQNRRLRPSRPETPARESGLPNLTFTRVVQASVVIPESLRSPTGYSETCHQGAGDFGPYRPETPGAPETLG
jgi:hypothetical protein